MCTFTFKCTSHLSIINPVATEAAASAASLFCIGHHTSDDHAFDLSNLTREVAMDLSSILMRHGSFVYFDEAGLVSTDGSFQTGNCFARQLLTLTADKLERR
jgi:hypothetical protein